MWARVENNIVKELTNISPEGRFHSSLSWVPCDDTTKEGDVFDGKKFSAPIVPTLTVEQIHQLRRNAYREESDPLKIEAEHDAFVSGREPDYSKWLEKVTEIKTRFPLPD